MLLQINFVLLALAFVASAPVALGRPVILSKRRFGQENSETLDQIRAACPGGLCDTIAGKAVSGLLAGADPCAQQAIAEELIDASSQFDQATADKMIAAAVAYRQAEKNTPPDFTKNPPALLNSVFCLTPPKFAQLEGLNQAQDPNNDPNLFFDSVTKTTVVKGSQANTFPLGSNGQVSRRGNAIAEAPSASPAKEVAEAAGACPTAVTVTVSGTATSTPTEPAVTITVGNPPATAATATATASAGDNGGNTGVVDTGAKTGDGQTGDAGTGASGDAGAADFGICTTPEIEFGPGFDNRQETSFQPKDKNSYNHGSAQNINIITQFICDELTNKCKANQAAKDLCTQAEAAAAAGPPNNGKQADDFNAVFGIVSNFAAVAVIDNQGRVVAGSANTGVNPGTNANTGATSTGNTTAGGSASTTNTGANSGSTPNNTNSRTSVNAGSSNSGTTPATNNQPQASTNNASSKASDSASTAGTTGASNGSANLQSFAGALGAPAPEVTALEDGKFQVKGNNFNALKNALVRSCDIQNNDCANAANASGNQGGLTVAACNQQQAACIAQAGGQ